MERVKTHNKTTCQLLTLVLTNTLTVWSSLDDGQRSTEWLGFPRPRPKREEENMCDSGFLNPFKEKRKYTQGHSADLDRDLLQVDE